MNIPKVGDILWVPPSDDHSGGMATVSSVEDGMSAGEMVPFVSFKGLSSSYNLKYLLEKQDRLHKDYGRYWAHEDGEPGVYDVVWVTNPNTRFHVIYVNGIAEYGSQKLNSTYLVNLLNKNAKARQIFTTPDDEPLWYPEKLDDLFRQHPYLEG
jgi:hypothetical protein